jgi:hypothetical protein
MVMMNVTEPSLETRQCWMTNQRHTVPASNAPTGIRRAELQQGNICRCNIAVRGSLVSISVSPPGANVVLHWSLALYREPR